MSSEGSGCTRAVDLRRNGLALCLSNSRSDHSDLSDCVLRGSRNFSRSRGGRQGIPAIGNGDMYGWGREGRVRLQPSVFLRQPGGYLSGCLGRHSHFNLNRENFSGLQNSDLEQDPQSIRSRLLALPYCMAARRPESLPYRPDTLMENGRHNPDPYIRGALGFPDGVARSHTDSLDSVSEYSLHHLDRLNRPYHYQPPYVEDYVSELEEELLRQQDDLESLHGMMSPSEFSCLLSPRNGYFADPRDERDMR